MDTWARVVDHLPIVSGRYIVWLQSRSDVGEYISPDDLSYATEMFFDAEQMIWTDGSESYNAILDVVNKEHADYVTHWMQLPERP